MDSTCLAAEIAPIYLDFQASTPVDESVATLMWECIRGRYGNPHSNEHAFGWAANEVVECARARIAILVDAEPHDIVFTSGATEANNLALLGTAELAPTGRDTILVSAIEHSSILEPARLLSRRGFRVVELPVDCEGQLRQEDLEGALSERVLLVSVGAVNNEIGSIQDLQSIGDQCRKFGALFHTDAAQALAARDVSLGSLPIDLASLSSHKSYGPQGIGALYVAPGNARRVAPQILGGSQQDGLRSGTLSTMLCAGFGRACELLTEVGGEERHRVAALREQLWRGLQAAVSGITLNGPLEPKFRHPGNLNVALPGIDARDLIQRLQPDLACSSGSACHSGSEVSSHVLAALGIDAVHAMSSMRLSLGRQTTKEEIEQAIRLIATAVGRLRALAG
jgi:cysteine desulfurase